VDDLEKYNNISIFSPNINFEQKEKIKSLYPEKNIVFNSVNNSDLYVIISNYYECKNSLDEVLLQIKTNNTNFKLLIYNLDENFYLTNDEMVNNNTIINEKIGKSISEFFNGYYYFSYFRHLIFTLSL
jgi:ribosomal protein S1